MIKKTVSNNFSDPMANVIEKAKNLIPEVYNVQFHFYKNNLPKLPNGKYDGVSLIKTIDFWNKLCLSWFMNDVFDFYWTL